jgi:hypothetical protein
VTSAPEPVHRPRSRRARPAVRGLIGVLVVATAITACGSSSPRADQPRQPTACRTQAGLDPADFVDPTLNTNPYLPTKPGTQWVHAGTTEVGRRVVPHEIITTMTDVIRDIGGIPTIAQLDEETDSGEVSQASIDYLALDKAGNVWLLGSYTEEYEGGAFTNVEDAWLGATGGTRVGYQAPKVVTKATPVWCIGGSQHEDAAVGIPKQIDARVCVKFGCYDHVRVVTEGPFSAPDNEDKYYAPGVGVIDNIPLDKSLHQDRFQLTNFVALSPTGLVEKSDEVLRLEEHARAAAAPEVFGPAPAARRATT